eukprot:4169875-Karenia_brevis.AAC.1
MRDKSGTIQTDRTAIANVFADFYEDLYSARVDVSSSFTEGPDGWSDKIDEITEAELDEQIGKLKRGKSRDKAGITAELFKASGKQLKSAILTLFNDILNSELMPPESWRTTCITVLFKGGDAQFPDNYRPIAILRVLYKLFSRLLLQRLKPKLEEEQSVDQAGFRSGFSTDDHLFTLMQLREKTDEWRQDLWIATVDFRKAFDTVAHG